LNDIDIVVTLVEPLITLELSGCHYLKQHHFFSFVDAIWLFYGQLYLGFFLISKIPRE